MRTVDTELKSFTKSNLMIRHKPVALVWALVRHQLVTPLAPRVGIPANVINGVKLSTYARRPEVVADVFNAMPCLIAFSIVDATCAPYLLYRGLTARLRNPDDKSIACRQQQNGASRT